MVNKMFHAQNRNNIPQYTGTGFNGIVTQMLLHENKLFGIELVENGHAGIIGINNDLVLFWYTSYTNRIIIWYIINI